MTQQTQLFQVSPVVEKSADFSKCGKYRYCLSRIWDKDKPKVLFVMLNPSTADSEKDDPTIRRCVNYAKQWGFGSLYVVNLFAFRATNPEQLLKAESVVGVDNKKWLKKMSIFADLVVGAWGNREIINKISQKAEYNDYMPLHSIKKPLHFLELSKDMLTPKHPLYLKKNLKPILHPYQHVPKELGERLISHKKFNYLNAKIKKMSQPSKSIGSILIHFLEEFTTAESLNSSDSEKSALVISTIKDLKTLIK
jgi:hypothetical protein